VGEQVCQVSRADESVAGEIRWTVRQLVRSHVNLAEAVQIMVGDTSSLIEIKWCLLERVAVVIHIACISRHSRVLADFQARRTGGQAQVVVEAWFCET
jgi:hypothetical protein